MSPSDDAYGQQVLTYFNGEKSFDIVERDDGRMDCAPSDSYFQEYRDWPKHQKRAIRFAKGRVLDIGAGAGRVSLYLQKRGFKATAIDSSPLAIQVCKKRGIKDARLLSIDNIDTLRPASFDTVIMYGNNFGLFGGKKKAKVLLQKLHGVTSPDALIVAESANPYLSNDPFHLAYHKLNRKCGRMPGQLRIRIRFRNYASDWFDYLFVAKKEMRDILSGTGWKIKEFVNSGTSRYIAIIAKTLK